MKFEVLSRENRRVFYTEQKSCLPVKSDIGSMSKSGYKFKLDGKPISKNKLIEIVKG